MGYAGNSWRMSSRLYEVKHATSETPRTSSPGHSTRGSPSLIG